MNSTSNWLRRHRLAALTAAAALTGLMLTPHMADAGHRRHARHCCCGGYGGSSYGHANYGHSNYGHSNYGSSGGYGYDGGNAYGGTTWSQPGYAQSGIQYGSSQMQSQPYISGESYAAEPQPSMATTPPQGDQITANRPNLEDGGAVPPAPMPGDEAAANTEAQNRPQQPAQQTQQLQQRIDELEQENARLKEQLEEARQQAAEARSAVEAEAADAEATSATSGTAVEADVPTLPAGKDEAPVEAETDK